MAEINLQPELLYTDTQGDAVRGDDLLDLLSFRLCRLLGEGIRIDQDEEAADYAVSALAGIAFRTNATFNEIVLGQDYAFIVDESALIEQQAVLGEIIMKPLQTEYTA